MGYTIRLKRYKGKKLELVSSVQFLFNNKCVPTKTKTCEVL